MGGGERSIAAFDASLRAQWGMALHIQCVIFVFGAAAAHCGLLGDSRISLRASALRPA